MSLFLNRGGDHEQEQTQKQKLEGFLSRVFKQRQDKSTQEGEEQERRSSLRTMYHQKQSENLWGDARRSSCSSRIIRDIVRLHHRLSGSSRRVLHTSRELFKGLSEGSLDPDQIDAIADEHEIGNSQSTSKAKAAKKDVIKERGIRRRRSATRMKTDQKKESAQTTACDDSDPDNSATPEDGFYKWPAKK